MLVLSNTTEQTLAPGQSLVFDKVIQKSGCGECFNERIPESIKLRADRGCYTLAYGANVGGPTAASPVQLAITLGGTSPLLETTAISVPAAVGDRNNVYRETRFSNCCCDQNRVSLTNTGANSIIVGANSVFIVDRRY